MGSGTILVVDDEQLIRWSVCEQLREAGYATLEAETGAQALETAGKGLPDLIILDLGLPDARGTDLIAAFKVKVADVPVIIMTADGRVETAVAAMKAGAEHYLNKPLNFEELLLLVEKTLETTRLRREVHSLKAGAAAQFSPGSIVGDSPAIRDIKTLLVKIARTPGSTVLLTGESGTGKDLAAKVIHYSSERAAAPFMNITCSALPEALLESELFGHERGAFTDAKERKTGLLEQADGGTVFLDEIGEMSPALQAKLLRFLEEKAFRRVGGSVDIRPDVRIIAATNRDLHEEVKKGTFREDLLYRLNVLDVHLPPLRDRTGDIAALANHYVDRFCSELRRKDCSISPEGMAVLEAYPWPGNVRELRNVIERAVLLSDGVHFGPEDFQVSDSRRPNRLHNGVLLPPGGIHLESLERELVEQALQRTKGNQTRAAELLGLNRDQIRYRIEKYDLKQSPLKSVDEA